MKPPVQQSVRSASKRRGPARRFALVVASLAWWGGAGATADRVHGAETLHVPSDVYTSAPATLGRAHAAQAEAAYADAKAAVSDGRVSDAFRHASRALAYDPDHAGARRLLGYRKIGDVWAGAHAERMLNSKNAWDPRFGWVKAADLEKYAGGRRPYGGQWITPEEDARRHAAIERGWAVRTDYFLVLTNIDRAAGVELAMRLETVRQLWRQLFGEFTTTPEQLKAMLDEKRAASTPPKPMKVLYHRDRQEYVDFLKVRQPQIAMTLGVYFDADREGHFFSGKEQDAGTIYHEAIHQCFYESTIRPTRHLGALANAWALEGVACYFESLAEAPAGENDAPGGRAFTLGAPDRGRLPAARQRRIVDDYYVPLAELSTLGMSDLQARADIAPLYSQSAGLATFFIDYENGKYRDAFRRLLAAIYAGRDRADTLERLAGRSFSELDAEYRAYMESLP